MAPIGHTANNLDTTTAMGSTRVRRFHHFTPTHMEALFVFTTHIVPIFSLRMVNDSLIWSEFHVMGQSEPIDVRLLSVLALLNFVPPFHEVLYDIQDNRPCKRHMYVMPRHPRIFRHTQLVANEIINFLEVHNSRIIVILTWEEGTTELGGMYIRERMHLGIPSAKAEVQTTDASMVIVNHHHLLVMGPELYTIFGPNVVRMTHTSDVGM
jgi:hypothetical protein